MAGLPYDPHEIEARWQAAWDDAGLYEVDDDAVDPATLHYNLVEFPYPSAEGLHVGHVFKYAGADVLGRMRRMQGRTVFQPMGWDSFGINAENYALKIGEHPATVIERTTVRFRNQLRAVGFGAAWSRELATSDPSYYRWTQWLFLQLFHAGLAHQAESPVLWCPSCLTVLAREQVEEDRCERCRSVVTEKVLRQWYLRITRYADELLDGLDGLDWPDRSKKVQREWIGRVVADDGTVSYRLHDWLISRQRYWGPPIPIVHCEACGAVPVPESDLPVLLPEVEDPGAIRPVGDGRSPLATIEEWVATTCPRCGADARRETDVSDTFFDSSWYFLRYPSSERDDVAWDADRTERFLPVDFYAGGIEHIARHHLYARFVMLALHDLGLVPVANPFDRLRLGGMIVQDGAKMSKSRGNVVEPDRYLADHGADVLRLHLFFTAPWDQGGEFRIEGIAGIERFLSRVWRRVVERGAQPGIRPVGPLIRRVTDAIDRLHHNVAVAALMEEGLEVEPDVLVRLLAPLAPFVAEELWHRLGREGSVHTVPWPVADDAGTSSVDGDAPVRLVVQVDGKVRGQIDVTPGSSAADIEAAARAVAQAALAGREVARAIHVAGKLINLVTR